MFNSSRTFYRTRAGCRCGFPRGDWSDPSFRPGKCFWRLAYRVGRVGVATCCCVLGDLFYHRQTNQTLVLIETGFYNVFGKACTIQNHFRLKAENLKLPQFPPKLHFRRDFVPPRFALLQPYMYILVFHKSVIYNIFHFTKY